VTMLDKTAGQRLKKARELRPGITLKAISIRNDLTIGAIQKWQNRGVSSKYIADFATHFFDVEDWVFLEEFVTDEDFEKIIKDPALQDQYRPIAFAKGFGHPLIYKFKIKHKNKAGNIFESKKFDISCEAVLVVIKISKKDGVFSNAQLQLKKIRDYEKNVSSAMRIQDPIHYIHVDKKSEKHDALTKRIVINIIETGYHYLFASCKNDCEIYVYDMRS